MPESGCIDWPNKSFLGLALSLIVSLGLNLLWGLDLSLEHLTGFLKQFVCEVLRARGRKLISSLPPPVAVSPTKSFTSFIIATPILVAVAIATLASTTTTATFKAANVAVVFADIALGARLLSLSFSFPAGVNEVLVEFDHVLQLLNVPTEHVGGRGSHPIDGCSSRRVPLPNLLQHLLAPLAESFDEGSSGDPGYVGNGFGDIHLEFCQ